MKRIGSLQNWIYEKLIPIQIWLLSLPPKNWASYHAQKIIHNSKLKDKRGVRQVLYESWFEWMHPKRWRVSIGLALALIALPPFLLNIFPISGLKFIDETFLTTVWQILASTIGISFVIVVFLTEYSQDRTFERRAFPIYISATSMIFIVVTGLLTLTSIGANVAALRSPAKDYDWMIGFNVWNSALFFINLTLTIILYIRTYQLLSPSYFRKILIAYHRKRVLVLVYAELFKRVKQNLSFKWIGDLGIQASIFSDRNQAKVYVKPARQFTEPQFITDINLDLIRIASQNSKKLLKETKKDQIVFWGLPGINISDKNPEIASLPQELNRKSVTAFLASATRTVPSSVTKEETASEELLINRDLISVAIASGQAENVESSLDLYIETIEAFLSSLKQLGYRYTPELAESEDGWLNRWDIFDTILNQYVSLLKEALKTGNMEIIHEFVSFPRRVMTKAFQYKDHLVFKRFAGLYSLIYYLSKQFVSDTRSNEQISERCGRLLAEFANYYIEPELSEKKIDEKESQELLAYATHMLIVFSQLAKHQIDHLDLSHFRLTIGSMRRLLREFINEHDKYKTTHLEIQIEHEDDEVRKKEAVAKLQDEKILGMIAHDFQGNKRSALFGLGTWVCHLLDSGKFSASDFENFTQLIGHDFENMAVLTQAYSETIETDDRNRFNWNGWEMDEWPEESYGEGKFGSMHFSSWLSMYYTYRALQLTPENKESILDIKPSPSIKGILDSTKGNLKHYLETENWQNAITKLGNINLRGQILEKSLQAAYVKQLEIEEIEVVQLPIVESKVEDFYTQVDKAWKEQADLRRIFRAYGRQVDLPYVPGPENLLPLGFGKYIPKGVFIKHPRIAYMSYGDSFGRSMALGEDKHIGASYNHLPSIEAKTAEFDEIMSIQLASIKAKGLNPIIIYGHELHRQFFESRNFETKWRTNRNGPQGLTNIEGFYGDTAVIGAPIPPNVVVIYDPSEFGELVQYKVDKEKLDFPLLFSVTDISEQRAKELLKENPGLRKNPETDADLSEEDALRKLRQNVTLDLWQKFEIQNINPKSGVLIKFAGNEIQ